MPVHKCKRKGKKGWQWGNSGKCYVGLAAKRRALKQAQAIYASGYVDNAFYATGKGGGLDSTRGSGGGKSGIEVLPLDSFKRDDADDEYLYHVTPVATQIKRSGRMQQGRQSMNAGFYADYSRNKVFFTERSAVRFWGDRIKEHLEAQYDRPPKLKVVRVLKSAVMDKLKIDELGTKDAAGRKSYYSERPLDMNIITNAAKKPARKQLPNPLRVDPTQTATLRRQFEQALVRRYAALKRSIFRLVVDEDAFGLLYRSTLNTFCPTGKGGGIDPTCKGKDGGKRPSNYTAFTMEKITTANRQAILKELETVIPTWPNHKNLRYVAFAATDMIREQEGTGVIARNPEGKISGVLAYQTKNDRWTGEEVFHIEYLASAQNGAGTDLLAQACHAAVRMKRNVSLNSLDSAARFYDKCGMRRKEHGPSLASYHFTVNEAADFVQKVQAAVINREGRTERIQDFEPEDGVFAVPFDFLIPTTNDRFRFETTDEQVLDFLEWLKKEIQLQIYDNVPNIDDIDALWWKQYVMEGLRKGAGRVFDTIRKKALIPEGQLPWYVGTREEFLRASFAQPVAVAKVKLLAGRVFTELEGINAQMAAQITRTLTDGLVQGKHPRIIAKDMLRDVDDITERRAKLMARTEIIRAHAEGQLDAMEALGVEETGVAVEWSTAADSRRCELCAPMEGVIFKVSEARGLIPRHPNCRCAFIPANVGESTKGQKRQQSQIQRALDRSIEAEIPAKYEDRTLDEQRELSRWVGADLEVDRQRPKSVLNYDPMQPRDDHGRWTSQGGLFPETWLIGAMHPTRTPQFKRWFGKSKIVDEDGKPMVVYHGTTAPEDFKEFAVGETVRQEDDEYLRTGSGGDPTTYLGSHFAKEINVADQFAKGLYGERTGIISGNRVIPVYLKIEKPFVTDEQSMLDEMLTQKINSRSVDEIIEELSAGSEGKDRNARYERSPKFRRHVNELAMQRDLDSEEPDFETAQELASTYRDALRKKGYDGIIYQNRVEGGTSYVIFEPQQAKSAIGNKGTFNPDDPNILNTFCATGKGGGIDPTCKGKGGSAAPTRKLKAKTRSEIAKATSKYVDKRIQRYAEEYNEWIMARLLNGKSLDDNEPADILIGCKGGRCHGIELKTMVDNKNNKITIKADAAKRKRKWERQTGGIMHTVVLDDSKVFEAGGPGKHDFSKRRIFYRRGYGSFRIENMYEVTGGIKELRALLDLPKKALPQGAK